MGSRDLIDSKKLINYYNNAICYSFECNPECLIECYKNMNKFNKNENDRIILLDKAVSLDNKKILFRPFDLSIYNNMGSSSILEIDFSIRNKNDPDYNKGKVQKEIEVDGIRIDTYMENNNIKNIDLLCIDLQGYELNKYLENYGFKYNNSNKFGYNFPDLTLKGFTEFDALFIKESGD